MDKTTRFTLREIYEAAATYRPELTYKALYSRLRSMRDRGELPETTTPASLTWEQAKAILATNPRKRQNAPRAQAIAILRKAMKDDGLA